MFIVYKLTNNVNGKSYIGISGRSLSARWHEHKERHRQGYRKGNRLYAALDKYGPHSFRREVIAKALSEDEARALESKFIRQFDTFRRGYNCNLGGHGFLKFPEHIKRKIGAAQKGKFIPAETREKMSLAKLGDSRCATNFGAHTRKGKANPRAKAWMVRFPDGSVQTIVGLRDFCRRRALSIRHMKYRGKTKGFALLKRLND